MDWFKRRLVRFVVLNHEVPSFWCFYANESMEQRCVYHTKMAANGLLWWSLDTLKGCGAASRETLETPLLLAYILKASHLPRTCAAWTQPSSRKYHHRKNRVKLGHSGGQLMCPQGHWIKSFDAKPEVVGHTYTPAGGFHQSPVWDCIGPHGKRPHRTKEIDGSWTFGIWKT